MNEKKAIRKFYECARGDDFEGCLEALKHISIETINDEDDCGYTMLTSAVVSGNACAVCALMYDNRCDTTITDCACDLMPKEHAEVYPEDSPIRQAFEDAPMQNFVYRDKMIIPRDKIFDRIMDDTIEADRGCFDLLPGDFYRAELVVHGKVEKEDFESWMNPEEMYWEGQIALLIGDEEYGRKFVNWDYIREAAEPDEWLSFLRDLPQYAAEADWEKLASEGSKESLQALLALRPELEKYL